MTSLLAPPGLQRHHMGKHPHRAFALSLLVLLLASSAAAVESGDFMCDARDSTLDTCVIAGSFVIPDGTVLRFTRNNVRVRGSVVTGFTGRCTTDPPAACVSDIDCGMPARCLRTGVLRIEVRALLEIAARAQIVARGQAIDDDAAGPNGGSITVVARSLSMAGTFDASAAGIPGVRAGDGGRIVITVEESVTLAALARLDASTARGGCGGSITIGGPETLELNGTVTADGATRGGYVDLSARSHTVVTGALQASNTDADLRTRPVCADDPRPPGGGKIRVRAPQIELTGSARARGKEGAGGAVEIEAVRALTIESDVGTAAISVSGGGVDALQPGGLITLRATAGDVVVRRGTIEADGQSVGFGSDAGAFDIEATGALRCLAGEAPCADASACAPGDVCVEKGGTVDIEAPLSAAGGAGAGFGCVACSIHGTASVSVSAAIDVGGGRQVGGGGKLTITGGGDLTIGPGPITASAADGGDVVLLAGERTGAAANVGGSLRVVSGTQVRAQARDPGGAAGNIQLEGCDVTLEPSVVLDASLARGGLGESGRIEVTARERLAVEALAAVRALPDGSVALAHRGGATIAQDVVFEPTATVVEDAALEPCPACGNGVTDPAEECDGPGSCAGESVCVPPGGADACTCADTCGTVPGIQSGEECDGADLGGQTCEGLGFPGGTLACAADCTLDTDRCNPAKCGDGLVGPDEKCDVGGIDGAPPPGFADETCQTRGFPAGGTLACTGDCSAIVTVPHCATSTAVACLRASDCPNDEACVAGCVQCGNGFVDAGEECDEGSANGSGPNRCRDDCRAPRCGDGTLDFPHCSGDAEVSCGDDRNCAAGQTCVAGERCDQGSAVCLGGTKNGEPCCRETDCPGGDCSGDDCEANRDDVPGCCRCSCTQEACGNGVTEEGEECDDGNREGGDCCSPACRFELAGGSCADDANPCTDDHCDGIGTCAHEANTSACDDGDACTASDVCTERACAGGAPLDCDDGDRCTSDGCAPASGCFHTPIIGCCRVVAECFDGNICTVDRCDAGVCRNQPFGFTDARGAVEAGLVVEPCLGQSLPARFGRLLGKAGAFIDQASDAGDARSRDRFITRARRRLRTAVRTANGASRRGVTGTCASALVDVVRSALERTECLRRASP
jgi:cysteine-rich repeat protein